MLEPKGCGSRPYLCTGSTPSLSCCRRSKGSSGHRDLPRLLEAAGWALGQVSGLKTCFPWAQVLFLGFLVGQSLWYRIPCAEPGRDQESVSADECGRPLWDPVCATGWYHGPRRHLLYSHQSSSGSRSSGTCNCQLWAFTLSPPPFPTNPEAGEQALSFA